MGIRAAITAEQRNADVVRRYLRVFETFAVEELAFLLDRSVIVHEGGTTVRGIDWVSAAVRRRGWRPAGSWSTTCSRLGTG